MFFSIVLGFSKEFIIVLLSFLFHELGHFLFLYLFKYKIKSISVYPFGGVIDYLNKPDFLYRYFFISVGGILVNSILFIFGCIFKLDILMDVNLLFILINLILFRNQIFKRRKVCTCENMAVVVTEDKDLKE